MKAGIKTSYDTNIYNGLHSNITGYINENIPGRTLALTIITPRYAQSYKTGIWIKEELRKIQEKGVTRRDVLLFGNPRSSFPENDSSFGRSILFYSMTNGDIHQSTDSDSPCIACFIEVIISLLDPDRENLSRLLYPPQKELIKEYIEEFRRSLKRDRKTPQEALLRPSQTERPASPKTEGGTRKKPKDLWDDDFFREGMMQCLAENMGE